MVRVRVLIDDAVETATFTAAMTSGWATPPDGVTVELVPGLSGSDIGAGDVALADAASILQLQQSHAVLNDIAIIAAGMGAIAMRTPVRPDEIEHSPVRLLTTSGMAAILARATLQPFYGIEATAWVRDGGAGAAQAQAVIVAGAEALREPEVGFSEDLVRAWFIFTAKPVVTHALFVPRDRSPAELAPIVTSLFAARDDGLRRRGEWLPTLANREEIPRERASAFWAAQRLALKEQDREALLGLLSNDARGGRGPNPASASVEFINWAGAE